MIQVMNWAKITDKPVVAEPVRSVATSTATATSSTATPTLTASSATVPAPSRTVSDMEPEATRSASPRVPSSKKKKPKGHYKVRTCPLCNKRPNTATAPLAESCQERGHYPKSHTSSGLVRRQGGQDTPRVRVHQQEVEESSKVKFSTMSFVQSLIIKIGMIFIFLFTKKNCNLFVF